MKHQLKKIQLHPGGTGTFKISPALHPINSTTQLNRNKTLNFFKMNKLLLLLAFGIITLSGGAQKNSEFTPLFNGKDLSQWIMPGEEAGFEVSNGILITTNPDGSDLFTKKQYGNFVLKFEYLLSEVGNSGVLLRCDPENPWETGVEVQLLAPWTPRRDDLHCTGSIYGHVPVSNRPDETTGIWHKMEIKCDRHKITVRVDGQLTTTALIDTVESMQNKQLTGAVGFQSNHSKEGEYARFRNIHINDLDSDWQYLKAGFYLEDAALRKQTYVAALKAGPSLISSLSKLLNDDHPAAQSGAKQALFDIAARSTDPGIPGEQHQKVARALRKSIKKCSSPEAADYLHWLLQMVKSP